MATKSYVVSGPLATPYAEDGSRVYLYEGALWPDGLREGETERFVDLKLISEAKAPENKVPEDKEPAKKAAAPKSEK